MHNSSAAPRAIAVAFVGGSGVVGLSGRQVPVKFGPAANALIRMRNDLVDAEVAEVAVDAPSDQLPQGMSDDFRPSVPSISPTSAP